MALLSISIDIAKCDHPSLDLLTDRFSPPVKKAVALLEAVVATALFGTLFYFGLVFVGQGAGQSALSLGISMQIPHAAVPVGAALSLIQIWLVALARLDRPDGAEITP